MESKDIQVKGRPIIQGRGLTPPGIVVLYLLGLFFIQTLENFISGQPGRITGLFLLALFFAAVKLGRKGTLFSEGFGLTGLLVGIVSNLARLAPWLLLTAIVSWGYFFINERRMATSGQRPSDLS